MSAGGNPDVRILAVRLGAMGDIIHALPAVAALKRSHPGSHLTWIMEPQWAPLVEANPFIDRLLWLRRGSAAGILESWRELRAHHYQLAFDFQGLLKSAVVAAAARPDRLFGFHQSLLRERAAALFYTDLVTSTAVHKVDQNLELAGAGPAPRVFPLPPGRPEGRLPEGDFVLASPLAGWPSKQWPLEHFRGLAARLDRDLGLTLVLNARDAALLPPIDGALPHVSGIAGLIYATRRAAAVVGVDSGPLHLAAALAKPGVAIFGPTDPARNGPYGDSLRVLRWPAAVTTYKRGSQIDESMWRVTPDEVFEALRTALGRRRRPADCLA